jgi:hypothetical protein
VAALHLLGHRQFSPVYHRDQGQSIQDQSRRLVVEELGQVVLEEEMLVVVGLPILAKVAH